MHFRILVIAAGLLGLLVPVDEVGAAAGRTPGSFSVTPSGAASYTIPILAPPGVNGLQPSVALVYSSSSDVGYVGRGWSLAGFSAITRCESSIAQDGAASPVQLLASDVFCLNGNRLRLTSGNYGQAASTYQTEIADFSLITAQGVAGTGPASFLVKAKNGLYYTYGDTTDSRVLAAGQATPHTWFLNEIRDRSGNKILFTYKSPNSTTTGATHPVKIQWVATSAGASTYVYSMDFVYQANVPATSVYGYVAGTEIRDTDLLQAIQVSVSGAVRRMYTLAYDISPTTSGKRLTSVTECSDAGGLDCLSPTVIQYQNGVMGANTSSSALSVSGALSGLNVRHDFNGDGIADAAYRKSSIWYVRFGSPAGYGAEVSTGVSTALLIAGDLLGNRQHHILVQSGGTWYTFAWNGSSFVSTNLGLTTGSMPDGAALSDTDGDGRDDLVYVSGVSGLTYDVAVRRNSSAGSLSFAAPVTTTISPPTDVSGPPFYYPTSLSSAVVVSADQYYGATTRGRYDVNGDGREDIWGSATFVLCAYNPQDGSVDCTPTGSNMQLLVAQGGLQYLNAGQPPIGGVTLDFNADGCRDTAGGTTVYISGCNGTTAATVSLGSEIKGVAHWDGDRRGDVLVLPSGSSTLKVQVSGGNGVGSLLETNISAAAPCQVIATDANGDGLDEVGCNNSSTGVVLYFHNGTLITPDLATSFTDGFGVNATVAYSPLAAPVYTPYLDAAYPQRDVFRVLQDGGGIQVVASAATSDGVNGAYTTTYAYYGATEDLQGRGFLAFDKIQATDSRNGMYRIDYYERTFPKTGQIRQTELFQSGGTLVSRQTVTAFGQLTWDTGFNQRFFAYPQTTTGVQHEVGGTANGTQILQATGSTTLDTFGNVTSATSTVTDTDPLSLQLGQSWTQATSMTYSGDASGNWCLGLPTSQSVTYTASNGEASVIRSQTMSPDNTMCRLTGTIVEPSSSTRKVVTGLSFDGFGNVESVSVTGQTSAGVAMAQRPSSAAFGTTGQFPLSSTVSPASGVFWTTARTFDSLTGQVATETDANGVLVLANTFDSFGRIQRSTQADSTSTYYTYANCATYGCENGDKLSGNIGVNKLIVIASHRDSTDTQIRADWTYLDQFDRPIVQKAMTLSGTYSRSGRQYDALGRVYRETAPCEEASCTSAQYWITNAYDLIGRVTSQTRPRSETDSTLVTTNVAHAGRAQTVTDAEGKVTTKLMDVRGLMRRSQDHNGYYQTFGYDAFGSLKSVGDSLGNTLFSANYSYGVQAFQDSTTDMDLGAWSYAYNSLGERTAWTDAKAQSFSMTFDWLSRPLVRTEPSQTTTWTWGSNAANKNIGRLATLNSSTPVYTETYTYDSIGRLVTKLINQASTNYTYNYAYNSAGQLDLLTFPTSTSSTRVKLKNGFQYGLLKTVTDWTTGSAGTIYWQANTQNARGQVTADQLGNGLVRNRAFDAVTGWQSNSLAGVGGGAGVLNQSYAYDKVGNVTQRQNNNAGLTESFYYDNLHRLDYSQLNSVTNLDVNYDEMGNITSRSDVASGAAWTYDTAKKHAVKTAGAANAYLYDANGNMTSRTGSSIAWTSYNYPTSMSVPGGTATIQYGPNRQYLQTVMPHPAGGNTETIRYIGEAMERRARGTEVDWRHFVRVGSETVAIISRKSTGTNAVGYVLGDHQGGTAVLTSNTGSVLLNESYAAFGAARNAATWSGAVSTANQTTMADISRHGYTDQTMLGFGGLIHMNGRVQDAITGRFLSPDPYVPNPGHTQSYNRYAYVRNNPLSYVDPSGFREQCFDLSGILKSSDWGVIRDNQGREIGVGPTITNTTVSYRQCVEIPDAPSGPGATAGEGGGDGGGGSASETPQSPQPLDPCTAALPGSGNAGQTVNSRVLQVRGEYGRALSQISGMPDDTTYAGVQLAQVLSNVNRLRPGGRWDTGEAGQANFLGNVLYGATVRELGIPLWMANRVGDAAEVYDDIRTGYGDGTYAPMDSPEARAQIRLGFITCKGSP